MPKHLKILLVIFILLLTIALLIANPFSTKQTKPQPKPLFHFKQEDIGALQINHFTNSFYFKKEDSHWLVKRASNPLIEKLAKQDPASAPKIDTDFTPANSVAVTRALTTLMQTQVTEPITTQKEALKNFEITEFSLHIICFDHQQKELGRVYVGKTGPDIFSSFIALNSEPQVYLVDQDYRSLFDLNWENWIAKREDAKEHDKKK